MPGDLRDHAEGPSDFVLAGDLDDGTEYELQNLATMDADEIPGEYPQYGTFVDCLGPDGSQVWVECPRGLAEALVDAGAEAGFTFSVRIAAKDEDGYWTFELAD